MKPNITPTIRGKSGQAVVEFIIGIVAVLALLAGLLQIMLLGLAHTETMDNARRQAGERALSRVPMRATPDYIEEWQEGDDESRHSADDEFTTANEGLFIGTIVDRAGGSPQDWSALNSLSGNHISTLRHSPSPATELGLLRGYDSDTVPVLPAVKHLLYEADTIEISSTIWMPSTTGIY